MTGYSDGMLGPNGNFSCVQFAQILFSKEGKPAAGDTSAFKDVTVSVWYVSAVI